MSDLNLDWQHCIEPPKVVCLCGSTRFMDEFFRSGWKETLRGRIVLSVGVVVDGQGPHQGERYGVKDELDELHFRKIDLADHILVLNVGGYVGASTQREIAYAMATAKPVHWLEPEAGEALMTERRHEIYDQVETFLRGQVPVIE